MKKAKKARKTAAQLSIPDPEDIEIFAGKYPEYVMGWNKVKHKQSAQK